jgi:hypothetical protein
MVQRKIAGLGRPAIAAESESLKSRGAAMRRPHYEPKSPLNLSRARCNTYLLLQIGEFMAEQSARRMAGAMTPGRARREGLKIAACPEMRSAGLRLGLGRATAIGNGGPAQLKRSAATEPLPVLPGPAQMQQTSRAGSASESPRPPGAGCRHWQPDELDSKSCGRTSLWTRGRLGVPVSS